MIADNFQGEVIDERDKSVKIENATIVEYNTRILDRQQPIACGAKSCNRRTKTFEEGNGLPKVQENSQKNNEMSHPCDTLNGLTLKLILVNEIPRGISPEFRLWRWTLIEQRSFNVRAYEVPLFPRRNGLPLGIGAPG